MRAAKNAAFKNYPTDISHDKNLALKTRKHFWAASFKF